MNCQIIDGGGGGGELLWVLFTCVCCASSLMPCTPLTIAKKPVLVLINGCCGPVLCPRPWGFEDVSVNGGSVLYPPLGVVKLSVLCLPRSNILSYRL